MWKAALGEEDWLVFKLIERALMMYCDTAHRLLLTPQLHPSLPDSATLASSSRVARNQARRDDQSTLNPKLGASQDSLHPPLVITMHVR